MNSRDDQYDPAERRRLCILGSTGSIGTQTLDVVRAHPSRFIVESLSAHRNADLLIRQSLEFNPALVVIGDEEQYAHVRGALRPAGIEVLAGADAIVDIAAAPELDVVVAAIVGFAGLKPVLAALKAGHRVGLANKETLVVAGMLVTEMARSNGGSLIPVDSEHSAIFQCLQGERVADVHSLVLTASGGPFRDRDPDSFDQITRSEALAHPNWEMGAKISIDSATMMNKGLEVIEAHWLFDMDADSISIVIHPQSIIHSMVNFVDGSTKAQLGIPDMRVPIQYALSFPERWHDAAPLVDWSRNTSLTFEEASAIRFPCLSLAYEALRRGGSAPATLNAANEAAVGLFLKEAIRFTDIAKAVDYVVGHSSYVASPSLDDLNELDSEARRLVLEHGSTKAH